MKSSIKPKLLPVLALAAGALGMILRVVLYTTGLDSKGLLVSGHWATTGLCILTAVTLAALVALTWGITGSGRPRISPLGCAAAGIALIGTAILELTATAPVMPAAASAMTLAGGICLLIQGILPLLGRKPNFLLYVIPCLTFALRMICLYRDWSSDPQLLDYCFYMGAYVALMFTAYEQASLCCGMGSHRRVWLWSLCALFLCLVSAWDSPAPQLLLGAALWCVTGLPRLTLPRRQTQGDGEVL